MRKAVSRLLCLASLFVVPATYAAELDIAVSSDVAGFEYRLRDDIRGSQWGVGVMHNDELNASLLAGTFNVVSSETGRDVLQTGLGLKAVVHDTFQTAASLALGGHAKYENLFGLGWEARLYYAPKALNTNDADEYKEVTARITYAVQPRATVFVGWTNITVEYDDLVNEVEIEDGFNVGFNLKF